MDAETARALSSGEGWALLQALPSYDEHASLTLQGQLRDAGFAPELVAAALTQSRLRARGREKFGEFADGMLFTADGLEQATRLEVAAVHARRFAEAGVSTVHDLGCGIGADAMALCSLDITVHAVDADEATAVVAATNLRHWSPDTQVEHARAEEVALPAGQAARHTGVWLDPARRTPGVADISGRTRRTFRLEELSPSWELVRQIAEQVPATGVKLSPGLPHGAVPESAEAQWVSWDGTVLECALWWGPLAQRPGRTALVLGPRRLPTLVTDPGAGPAPTCQGLTDLGAYLIEPDRAVVRAGLVTAVTEAVDGLELDRGVGYVTADRPGDLSFARAYAVQEAMPLNVKALRAWCRDRGVGRLTIKKRGASHDPDSLRKQLRLKGTGEATIALTRVGGQQYVLVLDAPSAR